VRKLPPAHSLTVEADGRWRLRRYWSLSAERPERPLSEGEALEAVHEALARAVRRRLDAADVPVGVLLSGGLDSSLLVALLAEQGVADLKTFTVGFEDQPEERGSEFEYSDQVVARYGTDHRRYHVPNADVLDRLPEAISAMTEPMVGQDAVAFYLLSEQVAREVKVVQSGQGADEVFGGYFWYPRMQAETGSDLDRFRAHYFDRGHDTLLELLTPELAGPDYPSARVGAELARPGASEFLDRVLRLDVTTLIVDDPVKRVDNMTMAWGLEARVPFLDHELVECVAALGPELKLAGDGKYLLKALSRGRIPDSVIDRPKGYFPVPALKFVRGRFLDFMREVLESRACRERGLYRPEYVQRVLAAPEAHLTRIQGNTLWHLAALELWLQRNVDAVPG
jgi:asparagine synthase (glutamine-hydrolysing)